MSLHRSLATAHSSRPVGYVAPRSLLTLAAIAVMPVLSASLLAALERPAMAGPFEAAAAPPRPDEPRVESTTRYRLRQTVRCREIPAGARVVRLWVPVPSDGPWQRVSDLQVIDAPPGWRLVRQDGARGEMIYVEVASPSAPVAVTIECDVTRQAVRFDLAAETSDADRAADPRLFARDLDERSPLMEVTPEIRDRAARACAGVSEPRAKVRRLLEAVADAADHYSKDPSKPTCGRGAAADCIAHGGGCCTDLHSLYIAMARAEGIPTRLQYGYRLTKANEGKADADPGYRCWVESFLPGLGWVPNDIVVADAGEPAARAGLWGTLDDRRVWLWEGRGHILEPAQTGGPIQTMIVGYAEIDGKAVDPLPAASGTPSALERRITFTVVGGDRPVAAAVGNDRPTSPRVAASSPCPTTASSRPSS